MRAGVACLLSLLFCGTAFADAAKPPLTPLPDYFNKSFAACAARPLVPMVVKPRVLRALKASFARDMKLVAVARSNADQLPDIIVHGVPTPPERPDAAGGAVSAYASDARLPPERPTLLTLGPATTASLGPAQAVIPPGTVTHAFVPLPIRRPNGIDDRMTLAPGANPPQAETKVAMLGAFPGAGLAINNLARLQPEAAIGHGACTVEQPFRLMALGPNSRTTLEPAAVVDDAMVKGLVRWEAGMQAAAKKDLGESVVAIKVAASYDCRGRNNIKGARLSEHGHANAIDIGGYITSSGKEITVKADFHGGGVKQAFLNDVHEVTCDVFQVVLGPGSDGYHEDHFHMDMGRSKMCR